MLWKRDKAKHENDGSPQIPIILESYDASHVTLSTTFILAHGTQYQHTDHVSRFIARWVYSSNYSWTFLLPSIRELLMHATKHSSEPLFGPGYTSQPPPYPYVSFIRPAVINQRRIIIPFHITAPFLGLFHALYTVFSLGFSLGFWFGGWVLRSSGISASRRISLMMSIRDLFRVGRLPFLGISERSPFWFGSCPWSILAVTGRSCLSSLSAKVLVLRSLHVSGVEQLIGDW